MVVFAWQRCAGGRGWARAYRKGNSVYGRQAAGCCRGGSGTPIPSLADRQDRPRHLRVTGVPRPDRAPRPGPWGKPGPTRPCGPGLGPRRLPRLAGATGHRGRHSGPARAHEPPAPRPGTVPGAPGRGTGPGTVANKKAFYQTCGVAESRSVSAPAARGSGRGVPPGQRRPAGPRGGNPVPQHVAQRYRDRRADRRQNASLSAHRRTRVLDLQPGMVAGQAGPRPVSGLPPARDELYAHQAARAVLAERCVGHAVGRRRHTTYGARRDLPADAALPAAVYGLVSHS